MKEVKINISDVGFPNQFVSDAEKATDEYGFKLDKLFNTSGLEKMETNVGFIISLLTLIDCDYMHEENSL